MRLGVLALLTLLVVTTTNSQDPQQKAPEVITWVKTPDVIHKNIHFVLDKSGSMSLTQLTSAMNCFLNIAEQSSDELNIAITVFGERAARWAGKPDDNTPAGWASLPNKENLDSAKEWLKNVEVGTGATRLENAIAQVDARILSRKGGNIDEITVIVISDLLFDGYPKNVIDPIAELRKKRKDNNCSDISLGFVGIYSPKKAVDRIEAIREQLNCWLAYISAPDSEEGELLPHLDPH